MWKKIQLPEEISKGRSDDPTFKKWASCITNKPSPECVLVRGLANDIGVSANFGRPGAAKAPDAFRRIFYRMVKNAEVSIVDIGDYTSVSAAGVAEYHQWVRNNSPQEEYSLRVSLGGGHDWAAVDFDIEQIQIIHIDTHLDVRPYAEAKPHSGMPFRYLAEKGAAIWCLGAQREYHSAEQWAYAISKFKGLVSLDDMEKDFARALDRCFSDINPLKPLALSIDMDAFPQSVSPGVSAPSPRGVSVSQVAQVIDAVAKNLNHVGIYELNPTFDRDEQSLRLGAYLLSRILLKKYGVE